MDPANRFPRQLYLLLVLLAAIQSLHYYRLLPATVASHFDGRGEPNGWQAKDVFFGFYWGGIALTAFLYLAVAKLVAWAPLSLINLPNKDYWLAPERKEESVAYIGGQMMWFATATLALLVTTIEFAIRANLAPHHRISSPALWILLGAYGLFVIQWLARFIARFTGGD